jgi:hypothetical protein
LFHRSLAAARRSSSLGCGFAARGSRHQHGRAFRSLTH